MEQLKTMKEQITSLVQGQLANVQNVDTKELGEAIDMIKDLAEACYYCSITEAMEDVDKQPKYQPQNYYMPQERMYYGGGNGNSGNSTSGGNGGYGNNGGGQGMGGNGQRVMYYTEPDYRMPVRYRERELEPDYMTMPHDPREGRSRESRRMYMESKEMHKDSATQMKELERYIKDLSEDITEMIQNATPEEKQVLQQKIATLSTKIK